MIKIDGDLRGSLPEARIEGMTEDAMKDAHHGSIWRGITEKSRRVSQELLQVIREVLRGAEVLLHSTSRARQKEGLSMLDHKTQI